jgi:murein L,D-transpeptidase YafK
LSLLLQRCYRFWKKLPKKDQQKYNTKINNNSSSSSSSSSFVSKQSQSKPLKDQTRSQNKRKQINLDSSYTLKIETKTKSIHLLCT